MGYQLLKNLFLCACFAFVTACYNSSYDEGAKLDKDVSIRGYSLIADVVQFPSQPEGGEGNIVVTAALYKDSERIPVDGGRFFQLASISNDKSIVLQPTNWYSKKPEYIYSANIKDKALFSSGQGVLLQSVYDPIKARADRWYPADKLAYEALSSEEESLGFDLELNFPSPITLIEDENTIKEYKHKDDDVWVFWKQDSATTSKVRIVPIAECVNTTGHSEQYAPYDNGQETDDNGEFSFKVEEIIPKYREPTKSDKLEHAIIDVYLFAFTYGALRASDKPPRFGEVDYCKVEVFVHRESVLKGDDLTEKIDYLSSGRVSIGMVDSFEFDYRPEH